MTTPDVTEVRRPLEPVAPDPFVEDLRGVGLDPLDGPDERRSDGGGEAADDEGQR